MVRIYEKVEKPYTQETIKTALQEVEAGASIRGTSKKYGLSFSLLRERWQQAKSMPQLAPNNESNAAQSEEDAVVSAAVENEDILTSMAVDETQPETETM